MNTADSNGAHFTARPRVARGGILVAGGGLAGSHVARGVGEATLVNPTLAGLWTSCPGADLVPGVVVEINPDRRIVAVRSEGGRLTIAYAELVVALGAGSGGIGSNPPAAQLGLPVDDRGRVPVDETLQVVGAPHVWALGDCAAGPAGEDVIGLAVALGRQLRGNEGNHE